MHEVEFAEIEVEEPVAELSVDGGKARLITSKGEPSEWRDYLSLVAIVECLLLESL